MSILILLTSIWSSRIPLDGNRDFEAAINVKSRDEESRLVYCVIEDFEKPDFTRGLENLTAGFHPINDSDESGLDYFRGGLLEIRDGEVLDHDITGPNNDIIDKVSPLLQSSIDKKASIYLLGTQFSSRDGIHNIHMYQGSLPQFANGVYQDGGIFFRFPHNHWVALFLAFASQKLPTDNNSVKPLPNAVELAEQIKENTEANI